MSTRVDAEEIESTRSEKLLGALMAAFLLVGAVWFYVQTPGWVQDVIPGVDDSALGRAEDRDARASQAVYDAELERDDALVQLDIEREQYKVALQERQGVDDARRQYDAAQAAFDREDAELTAARADAKQAAAAAEDARAEYDRESRSGLRAWLVAGLRLGFIAAWMVVSYRVITQLRRRESRYLMLAFAGAAVGAVMAVTFAVDYVTDYINPLDLGPFILSVFGVVATIVAFRVLQKYLAARLPGRRVRKGECPFCGFPLREAGLEHGPHCAGCGRDVVAPCAVCDAPRRVGSTHCVTCGAR